MVRPGGPRPCGAECVLLARGADRVDHAGERMPRVDPSDQVGDRRGVADVECGDRDDGPRPGEPLDERGDAGRPVAAPAGQYQMPCPSGTHQVFGDQGAQRPGAAGDQHRAVRVQGREVVPARGAVLCRRRAGDRPDEPRRQDAPGAYDGLLLAGGDRLRQAGVLVLLPVRIEVQQSEPAGPVGLEGAERSPRRGGVRARVAAAPGNRPAGHDREPGIRQSGPGQPVLRESQYAFRRGQRGVRVVARDGGQRHAGQYDRRHRGAPRDRGRQGVQVRIAAGDGQFVRARRRVTHHGPVGDVGRRRVRRRVGLGPRHPVEREQSAGPPPRPAPHLLGGGRAHHHGGHAEHRGAHRVRDRHPEPLSGAVRVAAVRTEPYPHVGRAGGVQRHTGPGERQPGLGVRGPAGRRLRTGTEQQQRMQYGVEQRGVDPEPAGLAARLTRQRHVGEHVPAVRPRRTQPLERRPVAEPGGSGPLVAAGHVERPGAGRRPLPRQAGARRRLLAERPRRVAHPLVRGVRVVVLGAGVHQQLAPAVGAGGADRHLDPSRVHLVEHDRRLEDEFLHGRAAHFVGGAQRPLRDHARGQQDDTGDLVVPQPPRPVPGGQPAGEDQPAVGRPDRGRQQPVLHRTHPGRRHVALDPGQRRPVVLALEGVRRQLDQCRRRYGVGGEPALPVDRDARGERLPESAGELCRAALVP